MAKKKFKLSERDKYLIFTPSELVEIEIGANEIMASSAIEGEELDRADVEISIMKQILNRYREKDKS